MKKEFEKERKDNQTEDLFADMPDMDDDEKFSQWLEEEYIKEADAIEESLLADRRYEDHPEIVQKLSVSRESFYQRAREEGLLEEEADESVTAVDSEVAAEADPFKEEHVCADSDASEAEMPETKVVEFPKKKHSYARLGRIAGIAGVCLICVFAASMSSEANRKYLVNSVRILSGNDSQLISYNDETNEDASTEESDAIADIEEKLGVEVPEFFYRPYGMEFLDYEIRKTAAIAKIDYQYNENIVTFYIDKQQEDKISNTNGLSGNEKKVCNILRDNIEICIKEMEDVGDDYPTYVVEWTYKDVSYQILGKVKLEEIKKIVQEMKF